MSNENEVQERGQMVVQESNPGFMNVNNLEAAMKCAELIASSSFAPKGMTGKPGDILIAMQMGQELGLKPLQALQNIAVINGRPSLWGDAMLAVCRQCPDFEYIQEEHMEKDNSYICRVKRRNEPEVTQKFSEADAKKAQLWGKQGPWSQYPKRMLQMRARGFALRDAYPDLLRGIITHEEAGDMPKERKDYSRVGATFDGMTVDISIDDGEIKILRDLLAESNSDVEKFCQLFGIKTLEELSSDKWAEACNMIEKKLEKQRKTASLPINQLKKEAVDALGAFGATVTEVVYNVDTAQPTDSAKEFFGEDL